MICYIRKNVPQHMSCVTPACSKILQHNEVILTLGAEIINTKGYFYTRIVSQYTFVDQLKGTVSRNFL